MTAAEEILRNLPQAATLTLILIFELIVLQEAVNSFHDAANAVATVIYANSLKPVQAIVMAAVMNFLGVIAELRDVADAHLTDPEVPRAALYRAQLLHLRDVADRDFTGEVVTEEERIRFRSEILDLHQALGKALDNPFLTEILTPS